jgi:hypothetical protein
MPASERPHATVTGPSEQRHKIITAEFVTLMTLPKSDIFPPPFIIGVPQVNVTRISLGLSNLSRVTHSSDNPHGPHRARQIVPAVLSLTAPREQSQKFLDARAGLRRTVALMGKILASSRRRHANVMVS